MNAPAHTLTQDGAAVAREAHNFEVAGSNPAPAPKYERIGAPFDEPLPASSGEWCEHVADEQRNPPGC